VATTYRVVTKGVSVGKSIAEVAGALSTRFRIPADKVAAALRAPRFVLKQGLNLVDAAKYDQVLRQAGCRVVVEPEDSPGHAEASQSPGAGRRVSGSIESPAASRRDADAANAAAAESARDGAAELPSAWRTARAWLKVFFHSRVRPWLTAWSAASARQKALAIVLAANGMVIIVVAVLLFLPAPGPRSSPESALATSGHSSTPPSAATLATLVGTWSCRAEKSSGFTIRDTYVFRDDGRFVDRGTEVDFEGVYQDKRGTIVMTVRRARTGTTTIAPNLVIDGNVAMLSESTMRLETTVRGSGEHKTATCSRVPEQSTAR
jgi:hypothetical protein